MPILGKAVGINLGRQPSIKIRQFQSSGIITQELLNNWITPGKQRQFAIRPGRENERFKQYQMIASSKAENEPLLVVQECCPSPKDIHRWKQRQGPIR